MLELAGFVCLVFGDAFETDRSVAKCLFIYPSEGAL